MIEDLPALVDGMDLQNGLEKALLSKVNSAISNLDDGDVAGTIDKLLSFINHVEAQRGKKITNAQADVLVAYAQNILAQL